MIQVVAAEAVAPHVLSGLPYGGSFFMQINSKNLVMKIAVVGAGNGGSFTALFYAWYGRNLDLEVELIYNPNTEPE